MVKNIAIVGLVREQAYEVGKILADQMEMLFFDCIDIFEFDNIPRDLSAMLSEYGVRYYRKKEKGMIEYACDFDNTVINLEGGMASKQNFKTIKKNCLFIYLHLPPKEVEKRLRQAEYKSAVLKKFNNPSEQALKKRIKAYKENADIKVDASSGSSLKIVSEIIRKIHEFYNKKNS